MKHLRFHINKYAEQFKIYVNSLLPDEIDEIENDVRANGNGLLSVRDTESTTELFDSFAMFYYINGRLPYTDGHLFVPDGEIPSGIQGEKLSLKEPFAKFFRTKSNGLVSAPFLAALLLFFAGKESLVKNFRTELYRNLTVEVLLSDNDSLLEFQALTDLCAEINVRLANSIFANHERAKLDMKKQLIKKNELDASKVDLETSKEAEIKKIEDVFDKVKKEEHLKDIQNFFIDDNDIFDHDEISESDRQSILDFIDQTNFIVNTKKFIEDMEAAKMEIVDPTIKQKMEKKEQISINNDKKQYQARYENSFMKRVKIKNEFLNEEERTRKRSKKSYRERVKKRMGEYYGEKKSFHKPSKSHKNNMGESKFITEVNVKNLK